MSALEAVAYAGLAIAVAGAAWYWLVRPLKALFSYHAEDERSTDDAEFRFGHHESSERTQQAPDTNPLTSEYERLFPDKRESVTHDWISTVFDNDSSRQPLVPIHDIPEGDFLRSPSDPDASDEDEVDPETMVRDSEILVSYRHTDGTDGPPSDGSRAAVTHRESAISNGGRVNDEAADGDAASADGPTDTDEEGPDPAADRPADPHETIADAIEGSRTKIDTVAAGLSEPGNGSGVNEASAAVADVMAETDKSLESLGARLPDHTGSIHDHVADARADQTRIQSAFGVLDED